MRKSDLQMQLEYEQLRYRESDFWYHPVIGKEVIRFSWGLTKYKGHHIKIRGIQYFDDFIMEELKRLAELNSSHVQTGRSELDSLLADSGLSVPF